MAAPKVGTVVDGYYFMGGDPNNEKSWVPFTPEKPTFTESMGRGVADVTQGIKQFGLSALDLVTGGDRSAQYTAEKDEERDLYSRNQGGGLDAGRIVGNIGATLPFGLLSGGAGFVPQVLRAGASGALSAGSMYVPEGESRAANAALGGVLSGAVQAVPSGYQALKAAAAPSATRAAAAADAANIGVRPTPAQATGSRTLQRLEAGMENTAGGGLAMEQLSKGNQTAINAAIAKKLGFDSPVLDREILGKASQKASKWYDFALKGETLKPDAQFTKDLDDIVRKFNPPGAELSESITKRIQTLKSLTSVDASDYQAARSAIGHDAIGAFMSGDTNKARALDALQEAYDDLAARNLPAHKLVFFNKAREQTRILKTVEKAADPVTGNVSTPKLVNAIKQKDPNFFFYGKGNNPLEEIVNAGSFLRSPPDSFTASRLGGMAFLPTAGGAYGYSQNGPEGAAYGAAAGMAAPYLLTRGYLGLTAPQGVLGPAAQTAVNYANPAISGLLAAPR